MTYPSGYDFLGDINASYQGDVTVYACPTCAALVTDREMHQAAAHPEVDDPAESQPGPVDLVLPERAETALALGNGRHAIRIAVASELRRLAGPDCIDPSHTDCRSFVADALRARADELDPPTRKD